MMLSLKRVLALFLWRVGFRIRVAPGEYVARWGWQDRWLKEGE